MRMALNGVIGLGRAYIPGIARWVGNASIDTAVTVVDSVQVLGHTLKDDLVNISRDSFFNSAVAIGTSLSGNTILSGERIYSGTDTAKFIAKAIILAQAKSYAPHMITRILPGSIAFSLLSSLANFCLIKEDEKRRRAGQPPLFKEGYNSLCLIFIPIL